MRNGAVVEAVRAYLIERRGARRKYKRPTHVR